MATLGTDTLDVSVLETLLGPGLTAEQAESIYAQGHDAIIFALLTLAQKLAEKPAAPSATPDPSAPSGQTPPYAKPAAKGRSKSKGARLGHPGQRRPTPTRIDRREEHTLSACPKCHGPVRPCRGSRTRVVEDIPADITPVVTEHTIHRSWCPRCKTTVEPTVPDALPGSTIGLRVVVLSAWLHYLLGTTLAQIIDVFNFHLQFKLSSGGLIPMWRRLREILVAWSIEIQAQALDSAVLHADETGWRVDGKTSWLWCFTSKDVTYSMIDRRRGSPALKRFFKVEFAGVLVTDFWAASNAVVCAKKQKCLPHLLRDLKRTQHDHKPGGAWPAFSKQLKRLIRDSIRLSKRRKELPSGGVRVATATAGRAAARTAGPTLGAAPLAAPGQAPAATRLRVVHVPGPSRSPLRQQPRRAGDPPGGDPTEEQLRQRQRGRGRDPSDPDDRLPHPEAARSQSGLRRVECHSHLSPDRPVAPTARADR
jgi:hypothetical protein